MPGPPTDTKVHGCSGTLYKMVSYLNITYAHSPMYLKSSLDYLLLLIQCKCHANCCSAVLFRE